VDHTLLLLAHHQLLDADLALRVFCEVHKAKGALLPRLYFDIVALGQVLAFFLFKD